MSSAPESYPPMELSQVSDTGIGYQPEETPTVPEETRDQGEESKFAALYPSDLAPYPPCSPYKKRTLPLPILTHNPFQSQTTPRLRARPTLSPRVDLVRIFDETESEMSRIPPVWPFPFEPVSPGIPPGHPFEPSRPSDHPLRPSAPIPSPATLQSKSARKLEQLLGEPKALIERSLNGPPNGVREYDVQMEEAEPESPSPGSSAATARAGQGDKKGRWRGRRMPEREREDCLVRRVPSGLKTRENDPRQKKHSHSTSRPPKLDELQVCVSRRVRVTETVSRGMSASVGADRRQVPTSCESQLREERGGSKPVDKKRMVKRAAKLQKVFGDPIPPELISLS
ncbi:hypothetical protein I350_06217 [Cryptococcus amylolentus CBS 6273]|uniref:Uncharacterized protein n=1 Tax=Cryptococcus amylolentus CBS 6273 TaxID=1296118 RepID=A0A1E3JKL1_9TREE|nr:hypothetical protein I350_06217 [Cryptococcus amylolentus CBS 6273]